MLSGLAFLFKDALRCIWRRRSKKCLIACANQEPRISPPETHLVVYTHKQAQLCQKAALHEYYTDRTPTRSSGLARLSLESPGTGGEVRGQREENDSEAAAPPAGPRATPTCGRPLTAASCMLTAAAINASALYT